MLEYDRIGISKGIDVNKTSLSKELIFVTIGIGFKYEKYLCNGCHDYDSHCKDIYDF